jgi:hypothetical protein
MDVMPDGAYLSVIYALISPSPLGYVFIAAFLVIMNRCLCHNYTEQQKQHYPSYALMHYA